MKHLFNVPNDAEIEKKEGKGGTYYRIGGRYLQKDDNGEVVQMMPHTINCDQQLKPGQTYEIDLVKSVQKQGYDLKVGFMTYVQTSQEKSSTKAA